MEARTWWLLLLLAVLSSLSWASWASLGAASPEPAAEEKKEEEEPPERSRVRELSGANWSLLLQGEWMVEFYAPWCPACQQMESAWEAFARNGADLELSVGKVDITQEPGISGRFFVTTLPTIYHAKDGIFRRYRGSRSLEDLEGYILERKWEAVEPVAGWKSPSSILMHGMAGLFYLSGWIRQIHNYLTGTLGLHIWASYAVFIVATLFTGLILGLILVLISDCISPQKSKTVGSDLQVPSEDKIEDKIEDKMEDKIEEQQEPVQNAAGESIAEKRLPEGENEDDREDESQEDSSDDSAVEGSQTEDELEHQESDKVEQSSLRQRKNQVDAAEL